MRRFAWPKIGLLVAMEFVLVFMLRFLPRHEVQVTSSDRVGYVVVYDRWTGSVSARYADDMVP